MKKNSGNFVKSLFIIGFVILSFAQLPASAQNKLSTIQINPDGDSYRIILKADSEVPVRKTIDGTDKIYIELQNIEPVASVNTIYNNVPNVENVIVKPTSKNSLRIFLQGKNMNKASVDFGNKEAAKNTVTETNNENSIEINPPINAYNPIYNEEENDGDVSDFALLASLVSVLKSVKNTVGTNVFYILGIVLIIAVCARFFKNGLPSQSSVIVGLPKNLRKNAELPQETDYRREKRTLEPLTAKGSLVDKTVTNYGIKNYRNAQRSPYAPKFRTPLARPVTGTTIPSSPAELKTSPASDLKSKLMTATLNSHASGATTIAKGHEVDSAKFIESMTKIYEKNGRTDLADGLRRGLKKAQKLN